MNSIKKNLTLLAVLILAASSIALTQMEATGWNIDKSHSSIDFSVRHFFTPVNGTFNDYNATVNFDPANLAESNLDVEVMISSVDTKNEKRDGHLLTGDFFDAETYPKMMFKSVKIEAAGENQFVAHGDLTIKDVTKRVELPFQLLGVMDHPRREGVKIAGISSSLVIDRNDYGVGTGGYAETAVIGGEVTINLNLELTTK